MNPKKIALFASGRGSNAINLINYFKDNSEVEIAFVLCNKSDAPIVHSAQNLEVQTIICTNNDVADANFLIDVCERNEISLVVLAGFLRKIPDGFVNHFPNKIVNIHPSLLPKYGGEGMYGNFVHQAVLANKEQETGITIHFVNAEYDKGEVIAQFSCQITENDNLESVQQKIHALEMEHFPKVISNLI
ncbi:MAG: phosphoribosylglycinamide formyltransferase [Flavobacteriia bacterium]|jgi:phosphoribosylglycinamide formyltransferase-1